MTSKYIALKDRRIGVWCCLLRQQRRMPNPPPAHFVPYGTDVALCGIHASVEQNTGNGIIVWRNSSGWMPRPSLVKPKCKKCEKILNRANAQDDAPEGLHPSSCSQS